MSENTKEYICQCGRVFNNSQAFNGHRSHCIVYLGEEKYKEDIERLTDMRKLAQAAIKQKSEDFHSQKDKELQQWISEEHKCERCGKIMTEFYGSGRFCSQECSNKRELSDESRLKISSSLKRYFLENGQNGLSSKCENKKVHLSFDDCVDGTKDLYLRGIVTYRNIKYYKKDQVEIEDFVVCPYCGARFSQLQIGHLKKHNKTVSDVKLDFGNEYPTISNKSHVIRSKSSRESQMALIEKCEHTGWRSRGIRSYAELFWERVLDNNHIKYDSEYIIKKKDLSISGPGCYFLDFLIDDLIDLEIDGKQHEYEDRKQSDAIRDNALKNNGYLIYRIPWKNPVNSEAVKKQIDDFLNWYKNTKTKSNIQSVNI